MNKYITENGDVIDFEISHPGAGEPFRITGKLDSNQISYYVSCLTEKDCGLYEAITKEIAERLSHDKANRIVGYNNNMLKAKSVVEYIHMEDTKNPVGRPSLYTQELADRICAEIASGRSLRLICQDEGMPEARTVHYWLIDSKHEDFFQQYARARNIQSEVMFDEILEIADDGSNDYMTITKGDKEYNVEDREVTNRSKLRVDTRKWYVSKVLPKKFGEKVDVTSDGKAIEGNTIILKDFSGTQTDSK